MALSARTGVADTGTTVVACAATTAKTVLNVIAASGQTVKVKRIGVQFDGVTSSDTPAKVELCQSTQATAGTSSAVTPVLASGGGTVQATAAKNYSAEPTVLTLVEMWLVDPNKGSLILGFDLGEEPESAAGKGMCLRVTASANVNCHASMAFGE